MTCANHGERTATAFCQNCGKPLCPECTRTADGLILCEPCFAQRTQTAGAGAGAGWSTVPASAVPSAAYRPAGAPGQHGPGHSSPLLAGLLGFIPGVGAMYNGQFVKALIHVVVFTVLVGVTQHLDVVGILIAAFIFYQVFDAAQTAAARRDGRPLPDPFGILDMSQRLGPQGAAQVPYQPPVTQTSYAPSTPPPTTPPVPGESSTQVPFSSPIPDPRSAPYAPVAPPMAAAAESRRGEPIGAIVLILIGTLFLLNTLGVFDVDWIGRGWPLILIVLGVWLLIRRLRAAQAAVPSLVYPSYPAPPAPPATSLSILQGPVPPTRPGEEPR